MSTNAYDVGDNVELSFLLGSTTTTAPETAAVHLVVTNPLGVDLKFLSSQLTPTIPSSDSTGEGWAKWSRLLPVTTPGRWTYQFTSTGAILASAGGAFAAARPLASTST